MSDSLNIASDWKVTAATVCAIGHRGAVINQSGLSLSLSEGRVPQLHGVGDDPDDDEPLREVWDYQLNFYQVDCEEPLNSTHAESMVAIVGTLEDGRQCKIHGNGYVGRDNLGQIEGTFFAPPKIELSAPEEDLIEWDRPPG